MFKFERRKRSERVSIDGMICCRFLVEHGRGSFGHVFPISAHVQLFRRSTYITRGLRYWLYIYRGDSLNFTIWILGLRVFVDL